MRGLTPALVEHKKAAPPCGFCDTLHPLFFKSFHNRLRDSPVSTTLIQYNKHLVGGEFTGFNQVKCVFCR